MAGYLVLVVVGLVLPLVVVVGYLVIALVVLLPIGLRSDSQHRSSEVTGEHP
jgi:hypothetical protein